MKGLQTEITHKGSVLYVQTQDKGSKAQYVESLVYASGKVLVSRKTFYTAFLNSASLRTKIRDIIRSQHQKIMEELSSGQLDHILTSEINLETSLKKEKK